MIKVVDNKSELTIGARRPQPARLRQAKLTMMTEMDAAALGWLLWQAHFRDPP